MSAARHARAPTEAPTPTPIAVVFVDFCGGEAAELDEVEVWLGGASGRPPEMVLGADAGRTPVFVAGGATGIEVTMVWKPPVDADMVTVEIDSDGFAEASGAFVGWELCDPGAFVV
jgi:hypothetical protein